MGAKAYSRIAAFEFDGCVVEIGLDRGEGSTVYLAKLASLRGVPFYGIDIDEMQVKRAGEILREAGVSEFSLLCGDGLIELANIEEKVGAAYLDNFDWPYDTMDRGALAGQQREYDARGQLMDKENSQLTHLSQALKIHEMASRSCVICFDDTWNGVDGCWDGKGGRAVPSLLSLGWSIEEAQGQYWHGYALLRKGD